MNQNDLIMLWVKQYVDKLLANVGTGGTVSFEDLTEEQKATLKGDKGDVGPAGPQGPQGERGPAGPQGPQGEQGIQGIQGEQGAKGDKGDTGATGAAGKDGANGKDGVSATHSWNGTTLTVTSASGTSSANLKGEKGDKGDTGEAGKDGSKMVRLWKNAKPTSQFAAQTISLNLSGYDYIKIAFGYSDSNNAIASVIEIENTANLKGRGAVFDAWQGGHICAVRDVTLKSNGVTFAGCNANQTDNTNNNPLNNYMCIPIAIYGIKA